MSEREAYIALNMVSGVGPVTVRALSQVLGSISAILEAGRAALLQAEGVGPELAGRIAEQRGRLDVGAELERAARAGARVITPVDAEYPKPLLSIHDPPLALYVRGDLQARDEHAVAVVGTRQPTHYGRETAERLAHQLAQCGFTVVSGMARGIDAAAHRGALKAGGRTVAVLGGALDCLFPPDHADLAAQIAGQGAVISEFPMGREPDRTTFPYRNRVVSGLSRGVVVVEAGLTSGAMITAGQALDQGRTVFAVPGRVDCAAARGPHRLLRQGARLVESVEDILQELETLIPVPARAPAAPTVPPPSEEERRVLALLENDDVDVDTLTRLSGLPAARVSVMLMALEMKRRVRMLPGRRVALRRSE